VPSRRDANDESLGCTCKDTVFQPDSRESVCVVCAAPERGSMNSIETSKASRDAKALALTRDEQFA
jgi:hypothetical protein